MTGLDTLIEFTTEQMISISIIFFRVSAAISVLPIFGERSVPIRIKLAISLCLTVVVATPVQTFFSVTYNDFRGFIWLASSETVTGLILGISIRMFVFALQTAGSIAAQSTSLAQLLGNPAADPLPAIGHILTLAGLTLLLILGFHTKIAVFFINSYQIFEIGLFPAPEIIGAWGINQVSTAFALAFQLSAPFILVSLIYNLTLGVINKAMPQLMVAFVGAPLITWGALALLMLTSGLLLSVWAQQIDTFIVNPSSVAQ